MPQYRIHDLQSDTEVDVHRVETDMVVKTLLDELWMLDPHVGEPETFGKEKGSLMKLLELELELRFAGQVYVELQKRLKTNIRLLQLLKDQQGPLPNSNAAAGAVTRVSPAIPSNALDRRGTKSPAARR